MEVRVWPVFVAYALAFVAIIVIGSTAVAVLAIALHGPLGALDQAQIETLARSAPVMLLGAGVSVTTLVAAALLGAGLSPERWRTRLRLERPPRLLDVVLGTLAALAIGETFSCATQIAGWYQDSNLDRMGDAVHDASLAVYLPLLVVGSLGAGIGEELFFRGYMQTRLVQRWGRWTGIVISAMGFALMHLDPLHTPFALVFGLYLGWLAETRGDIALPIIVHVINNLTSFLMMRLDLEPPGTTGLAIWLGVAVIIGAASIAVLRRRQ